MGRSVDRARRMEGGREGGRLSAGKGTADVTAAALHHHRYLDLHIYTGLCRAGLFADLKDMQC